MQLGNVLIIGDSYSTFEGYVPEGYRLYYTTQKSDNTDVTAVEQTWWHRLLSQVDANLVLNNSWSGSTIGYTGYNGEDYSTSAAFIYRLRQLKAQGFFEKNKIDTVFVFGGTNDHWCNAPAGENITENWQEQDLYAVRPAVQYFMYLLRQTLPDATIYSIVNTELKEEVTSVLEDASARNNICCIRLKDIDKMCGHPTIVGMAQICDQVCAQLN